MPVDFEYIPPDMLLPLFYAEVTAAPEPYNQNLRVLLIGHQNLGNTDPLDDGIAIENTLYNVTRDYATYLFGRGSMLEWMYETCRQNAPYAEIWCLAIPEETGVGKGIAATGTITATHAANNNHNGTARFWVAGRPVNINVGATDTLEIIANKVQRAITRQSLPVQASGATGTTGQVAVTLKCKWRGGTGNEISLSFVGPHGRNEGDTKAVQLARYLLSFTNMTGGSGEAEAGQTFAAIGDKPFDIFVFPYTTQNLLDKCQEFMSNSSGRWSPSQQLYGHMVATIKSETFQTIYDLGYARNDPHMSILGIKRTIMPTWQWSAALASLMVVHWAAPPELSRPLQTLILQGMYVGSDDDSSWIDVERQMLLEQGISTFHVNRDTTCAVDRVRTTRKINAYGDPDPSWADAIVMFQAQFFVRAMRTAITGAFPRAGLTDEPTGINGFTSPSEIEMVLIHEYERLQGLGLVENSNLFAQFLVCERNSVDPNRVDVLMRPDFVNQLRVCAVLVETHLELDPTSPLLQQSIAA